MKKIAAIITDTHFKENNHDIVYDIFVQLINYCNKNDIKTVFHAGDVFTNRSSQTLQTLHIFNKVITLFSKNKINLYAIPGNHDKTNQDSIKSYLDLFRYRHNFYLFNKETLLAADNIVFGFIPFFTDSYEKRLESLTKTAYKDYKKYKKILITHKAFNGVRNNDGSIVDDGINFELIKKWDKVLVGHYHDESIINKKIHYIGSSHQANFGENITDKGFSIIYEDLTIQKINTDFPKFIKIEKNIDDDYETELELYSNSNDNVRIIFTGNKENLHKVDRKKLNELGIDVKLELNEINDEILFVEDEQNISKFSKKVIINYFKEYCKIQEIDDNKMKQGLKILLKEI